MKEKSLYEEDYKLDDDYEEVDYDAEAEAILENQVDDEYAECPCTWPDHFINI